MIRATFDFTTKIYDVHVRFTDKYVFLTGLSGKGKTAFMRALEEATAVESDNVKCSVPYMIVQGNPYFDGKLLPNYAATRLLICDEQYTHATLQAVRNLDMLVLAIGRADYDDFNFSGRCIYEHVDVGNFISFTPQYNPDIAPTRFLCDSIVTEDRVSFPRFLSSWYSLNIVPADGKRFVEAKLDTNLQGPNIAVVFDLGGVGMHYAAIQRSCNNLRKLGYNVAQYTPECFEHMLLCSKWLGVTTEQIMSYPLTVNNSESYCEELIQRLTKGTKLVVRHKPSRISSCWLKPCESVCTCDKYIENKLTSILENGPVPEMLGLRGRDHIPVKNIQLSEDWLQDITTLEQGTWYATTVLAEHPLYRRLLDAGKSGSFHVPHNKVVYAAGVFGPIAARFYFWVYANSGIRNMIPIGTSYSQIKGALERDLV